MCWTDVAWLSAAALAVMVGADRIRIAIDERRQRSNERIGLEALRQLHLDERRGQNRP